MNKADKIRDFLVKLQNLPDEKKKIILWTIVAILAFFMGFFWVRGSIKNFSEISEGVQSIKMPSVDTSDMPKLPNLDILQTVTPTNK